MGGGLMRGRRPEKLTLARRDQDALHSAAHSGSLPWFQVQRAKVVLAIAAGERQCSVAARLECDEATVWRACERYRQDGLARLFADGRQGNAGHRQLLRFEFMRFEITLHRILERRRTIHVLFPLRSNAPINTALCVPQILLWW